MAPTHPNHHADAERFHHYEVRRKRRRRRAVVLLSVLGALWAAWLVVAHSPLTRRLVIPRIENLLHASVEGGDVSIGIDGLITIRNASVRAPRIPGTAGVVFEVKRINVMPSWARLLGRAPAGTPMVSAVEMFEPVVRFSQSVRDGSMNIAALSFPSPAGGTTDLPRIEVRRGILELGEHWTDEQGRPQYAVLKQIDINGAVSPSRDLEQGVYQITVQQIERGDTPPRPDVPRPTLVDLTGTVSAHGVSLTMSGLSLDQWPASSVPSRLREVFEFMDLSGLVSRTRFDFDDRVGMRAELDLVDVSVNLPINSTEEPLEGPVPPSPPARMRSVNGTVKFVGTTVDAQLNGLLEDLPYRVGLKYLDLTADAPFECDFVCENFRMEEKPQILRFAHPLVRYRLAQFSNPTGIVTARAHVSRGKPADGHPGDVKVTGTLEVTDATAAYRPFPYRFSNLKGSVRFDDQSVDILSVEGTAPSGARIKASARIAPLTDAAAAHIEVKVTGVPIDKTLEEAMGQRKRLIDEVANRAQYDRLVERGVVLSPDKQTDLQRRLDQARARAVPVDDDQARDAARREIADLEQALKAPVFTLRGSGDVDILIDRMLGQESIWTETIDVVLGHAGILPDRFPIPIVSDGVHVVIDGETVQVRGGSYRGLSGGTATVTASMRYPTIDNPDIDPLPSAHIVASGIPIDTTLVHAVAGSVGRVTGGPGVEGQTAAFVRDMLTGLRLGGTMDAVTDLKSDESGTHVAAVATSADLTAHPRRAGDEVGVRASRAKVAVSDSTIDIEADGAAEERPGAPAGGPGAVSVAAHVLMPAAAPTRWTANIHTTALDLSSPVEAAVGVFSETAAAKLAALRDRAHPAGRADTVAELSGGGGEFHGEVAIDTLRAASFDIFGGRVTLDHSGGLARFLPADEAHEASLQFEELTAPTLFDGQDAGELTLNGTLLGVGSDRQGGSLTVGIRDGRFELPLVRRMVGEHSGQGMRDLIEHTRPEGLFDSTLIFANPAGAAGDSLKLKQGLVRPRSLAVTLDTGRVEWPRFSGDIEFDAESGVFRALHGQSAEAPGGASWSFDAGGSWVIPSPGAVAAQADLSLNAHALPESLLAVLPKELTGAIRELSFDVTREITVPRAAVRYNDDGTSAGRSVHVDGRVETVGASLKAGVPVTDCDGAVEFSVERPAGSPAVYDLWGTLDRFKLARLDMTDGRLRLSGGGPSGAVLVPMVSANCYGGRMSADMAVRPDAGGQRKYEASVKLSGARFAPVLRDLGASGRATADNPPDDALPARDPVADDESRGRLDTQISIAGIVGDDASRRGRGSAVVGGGQVLRMPLLMSLIQMSNFQLPMGETLRLATGEFYMQGQTVVFENISVFSDSVRIFGYGTATWPDLDLDLRFSSRAVHRLPVLSGLIESIRDELISLTVTGRLGEPVVTTTPLGGAAQTLERLFGSPSAQEKLMRDIERRAMRDLDRVRTRAGQPSTVPTNTDQ